MKIPKIKQKLTKKHFDAGIFMGANAFAGFLTFLTAAYLGRVLNLYDFALISFINGLAAIVGIIYGSLGTTMIYKTGYLMGKFGEEAAIKFWMKIRKRAISVSLILTIICIAISPFFTGFFKLSSPVPLIFFAFIILVNLAAAADRGLLFSKFNFRAISIITIADPLIRLLFAIALVYAGLKYWTYTSIPLAAVLTFLLGWRFVAKNRKNINDFTENKDFNFPLKFFFASFLTGLSSIIFLNLDVVMAKHFLSPTDAGLYSLSALIGKMIYFLGALASPFFVPWISRNEGANKDSKKILNYTMLGTLIMTIPPFIAILLFGKTLVPFMFGPKAIPALPFITLISFAMVCFSVTRVYSGYYLVKKHYGISIATFILGLLQLLLLQLFHDSVWTFVVVTSFIWITYFVITIVFHLYLSKVKSGKHAKAGLSKLAYAFDKLMSIL